jgi:predicted amidophosphoribosyltransferase
MIVNLKNDPRNRTLLDKTLESPGSWRFWFLGLSFASVHRSISPVFPRRRAVQGGAMGWIDALFPADCAGCGSRGALVCRTCLTGLSGPAVPAWPSPTPPGMPPPWAVAAYADPCRALLIAYKEHGAVGLRRALAVPLAASIGAAWEMAGRTATELFDSRILVVPVPSAGRAVRTRGDDVVLGLTRRAAANVRRAGVEVMVVPALRHARAVADSAGLTAGARAANLADAFVVRSRARGVVNGATVFLADDLVTTGASLAESARALRAAGASVVGAATVAATQRHRAGLPSTGLG